MTCSPFLKAAPFLWFLLNCYRSQACQCPHTPLNLEETHKYEIIFRGTVETVKPCGSTFGEAVFKIDELYKGNASELFTVLFECGECATGFRPGDEWIIYTRYKQINNAKMDWCSRSRKYFAHEKEDFYKVNSGVDYFEELNFLRKNLGLHRTLAGKKNQSGHRNDIPDRTEMVIVLLCSLAAIIAFYFLFKKFFR